MHYRQPEEFLFQVSLPAYLGEEVEERPHAVLQQQLVRVVERDGGRKVALDGAPLRLREEKQRSIIS